MDYTQLRQRLEKDKFQKYQINKILAELFHQQENKRIGYHRSGGREKINILYPFAFGLLFIGSSVYFYLPGGGMDLIENSRGTGWNEYHSIIGMVLLMITGISLLLHGWMEWKKE